MFCFGYITSGNFDAHLSNLLSVLKAAHGEQCRFLPVLRWNMPKLAEL